MFDIKVRGKKYMKKIDSPFPFYEDAAKKMISEKITENDRKKRARQISMREEQYVNHKSFLQSMERVNRCYVHFLNKYLLLYLLAIFNNFNIKIFLEIITNYKLLTFLIQFTVFILQNAEVVFIPFL